MRTDLLVYRILLSVGICWVVDVFGLGRGIRFGCHVETRVMCQHEVANAEQLETGERQIDGCR